MWPWIITFVLWSVIYVLAYKYLRHVWPLSVFFDAVDPFHQFLWRRSKTVLAARLVTLVSAIVAIHDVLAPALIGFDWTPLLPPEWVKYVPLAGVLIGVLFEWLRALTKEPLKEKEENVVSHL